jgi:hypothetical protein
MGSQTKSGAALRHGRSGRVELLCQPTAATAVGRLFHRLPGRCEEAATTLLGEGIALVPETVRRGVLVAGAGLVTVMLPSPTRGRLPTDHEFLAIAARAREAADAVRRRLPVDRPTLAFGIDVLATWVGSDRRRQVGQFSAVLPAGREDVFLTAKAYPTHDERACLRVPDPGHGLRERALATPPIGRALVLVCHDVNAYSTRGLATTTTDERKEWRTWLRNEVQTAHADLGFHLVHAVETARSFAQAYGEWAAVVRVPLIGVSGFGDGVGTQGKARELAAALITPSGWPVFDLWETADTR